MKNIFIIITLIFTSTLFAKDDKEFISIGAGVKTIDSNMDARQDDGAIVFIAAKYKVDDDISIYLKGIDELIFVGSSFRTDYGIFDIAVGGNFTQEWDHPFDLTNRKKIDSNEIGVMLGYGLMTSKNHRSMFRVVVSDKTYSQETLPDVLKRSGNRYAFKLENSYHFDFLKGLTLLLNTVYSIYDAEGEASSYTDYIIELGAEVGLLDNLSLAYIHALGDKRYEDVNPIYNKTVKLNTNNMSIKLTWDKPFGYEDYKLSYIHAHEKEKANVDFYDVQNHFNIISVGYKF